MVAYPDLPTMLLRRWLRGHCSMIQTQNATTTVIIIERITIAGTIIVMMDVAVITGSKLGEFRT